MAELSNPTLTGILAEIIEFRHRIHSQPELSGEEKSTSLALAQELMVEGLTVQTFDNSTGLVAQYPGKDRSKAVAIRADLDALPLQEKSGKSWASQKPGIMHACGHDGHASLLLGLGKWLARTKPAYPIDIHLIFQPAEESGQGAPQMIENGILHQPRQVEAIFGLHGWPELPVGKWAVHETAVMASVDNFDITLFGKGAHGAMPHQGVDPIVAAAQLILAAQTLVSRNTPPLQSGVVTVGAIESGKTYNIIPVECRMKGTIRAFDPGVRKSLCQGLEKLVAHLPQAMGLTSEIKWTESTPATNNHPAMSQLVREAIEQTFGSGAIQTIPPSMGGEDFSYFLEKVPGAYFWLGLGDGQGLLHNPRFDFNDHAFEPGLQVLIRLLELYGSRR
jgi:amidohydrolase